MLCRLSKTCLHHASGVPSALPPLGEHGGTQEGKKLSLSIDQQPPKQGWHSLGGTQPLGVSFGEPKEEQKVCGFLKYVFKICRLLLLSYVYTEGFADHQPWAGLVLALLQLE